MYLHSFCVVPKSLFYVVGGKHMGFDYLYLQSIRKKKSPTDELLTEWGNQNHTVKELFILLFEMQHYRAMRELKDHGKKFFP